MTRPCDKPSRPVLRLVPPPEETTTPAAETAEPGAAPSPKRPKSALGQFLSAYADAIDRDVQLLMDL